MKILADIYVIFSDILNYFVEWGNRLLYFFRLDLLDTPENADE